MKTIVWLTTAICVAIWSLLAWAAYALIGVAGNFATTNSDWLPVSPELVELFSWLASTGTGIGEVLVIGVWGLVSLLIIAVGAIARRLLSRKAVQSQYGDRSFER
jgi:hypothetical protein